MSEQNATMNRSPKPLLCLICGAPAARRLNYAVTLMMPEHFFDDEGREHYHDPNDGGAAFVCQNGHEWWPLGGCWCGWKNYTSERYLLLLILRKGWSSWQS